MTYTSTLRRHLSLWILGLSGLVASVAPATQVSSWAPLFKGIDYATATNTAAETPGPLNVYVLRIALHTPGISFTTTPSSAAMYPGFETFSQTTSGFVNSAGAKVGINANFFTVVSTTAQPQNLFGLAVANGVAVSQPETNYPALTLSQTNAAAIVTMNPGDSLAGIQNAVAGSSIILQNCVSINPPAGTAGDPYNPNPRSAAGISQDGSYLYLMVIDGRSSASVGCTQQQAGTFLALFGAYQGLNLDGGGSSALVRRTGPGIVTPFNTPSGGSERLNGNNLAVFADSLPTPSSPVLPYSQTVATHAPVAFYRFSETSGTTVADSSGNAWNGTFPASGVTKGVASTPIQSEAGTSAAFNGAAGTHVTVPYKAALNPGSFTVEAWVRPTSISANTFQGLVSNRENKGSGPAGNAGYILYLGPATGDGGKSRWQFWTGGTTADTYTALGRNTQSGYGLGPEVTINTWTHLAGTFAASSGPDGNGRYTGTQTLYVNGAPALTKGSVSYLPNPNKPLYIGAGANEGITTDSLQFSGGIDEVAVYGRALSAAEVQAHYVSGVTVLSAPAISLSSPSDGASFPAGSTINLIAEAADADGSITKVEFFDGATKLGEVTTAPFSYAWAGASPGAHSVSLKATDDSTLTTTSGVVSITVLAQPASYDQWAASVGLSGPDSGATDDADNDGILNVLECAFGTSPQSSEGDGGTLVLGGGTLSKRGGPVSTVTGSGAEAEVQAVFCRRTDAAALGLVYAPQFSADLAAWETSTATPAVLAADGYIEAVSVPYPLIGGKRAQFFRVAVTMP